jgi:cystathionine beta-lyase family protein involved in aluminum resistance
MARFATELHALRPDVRLLVDNSYAEFTDAAEPTAVGADLIAGSWTKNPGGGIAPSGGYVAGRADLVERALTRITVPGQGAEVGAWPPGLRLYYEGLFLAPGAVREALLGAIFARHLFQALGFRVDPRPDEPLAGDIVTRIEMGSRKVLLASIRAIQTFSPVDSMARPEPDDMPGYADPVVMAAGTFVQGGGLELTADAPVRAPYDLFVQGGLAFGATKRVLVEAARAAQRARSEVP